MIPYYSKEPLLFPRIQSNNENNSEVIQNSDISDMVQNELYISKDNSDLDDNVFDDDPCCDETDDQSITFNSEIQKSAKLEDNHNHPSRS